MRQWVGLCALAEAIGMTAAAAAAKATQALQGRSATAGEIAAGLCLIILGGLVEGVALGTLQANGLRRVIPALDARRWALLTTLLAGLGWAAASAPAALSGPDEGATPPLLLVLVGAALLGAVLGAALGAVQSTVLRGSVRHPRRWIGANALAWAPTMSVIFLGATSPSQNASVAGVVALGAATGLAAGAVLGAVTWWFLPSLDGAPAVDRLVLLLLASGGRGLLDSSTMGLRVWGAVSGRPFTLPVQYAHHEGGFVVLPGRPETKRWWRNLQEPAAVEILLGGRWSAAHARVLRPDDPGYAAAAKAYRARLRRARMAPDDPLVRVEWR